MTRPVPEGASEEVAPAAGFVRAVELHDEGGLEAQALWAGWTGTAYGGAPNVLIDNARFLVEKALVRLSLEPEHVRRAFLNVRPT